MSTSLTTGGNGRLAPLGFGEGAGLKVQSVSELVDAVKFLGAALYNANRFGFHSPQDAESHAMIALLSGKDPWTIVQELDAWQIIAGQRQMKYRHMVSRFIRSGGKIKVIERSPQRACAELSRNGQSLLVEMTWEEAVNESYIWQRDAATGKAPRFLKDNSVNWKALKDNWSTPRRAMQMMWARAVSDGIATIAADVMGGAYITHEISDEPSDEVIEGEIIAAQAESPVAESPVAEPSLPAPQPVAPQPQVEQAAEASQLERLRSMKDELQISAGNWKQIISKYGVASAKDLSWDDADHLESQLMRQIRNAKMEQEAKGFFDESLNAK